MVKATRSRRALALEDCLDLLTRQSCLRKRFAAPYLRAQCGIKIGNRPIDECVEIGLTLPGHHVNRNVGDDLPSALQALPDDARAPVYPGIAETANVSVSDAMAETWRCVATLGGDTDESFTFLLDREYLY